MAGSRIQLDGVIRLGPTVNPTTDYSLDVASLVINATRADVAQPATYGFPRVRHNAGARKDTIALNFMSDESDTLGVLTELLNGFLSAAGLVYFQARWNAGAIGAANQEYRGSFSPTSVDIGTTVGQWKMQNKTFPLATLLGPFSA